VNRRCAPRRSAPADDSEVCISVEVYVHPHPLVHLTAGHLLMILLQELHDDRVPVHLVQIALSGQLGAGEDP